ncbi:hypothetical protein B0A55_02484 [Friedmanniomyces simplex]|uniref:Uncharacterized protein n=1 Tax=Friedmanniomyces simplex TaxID=329884 RepID=A0A4U0XTC2_9PEZI|nr:hypothetical protein B0A55_02484 [Friedmanniomyces simplex]
MANNKPATQPFRLHRYPIGRIVPVPAPMPMISSDCDDNISLPSYHSSSLFPHYNPDGKHLLPVLVPAVEVDSDVEAQRVAHTAADSDADADADINAVLQHQQQQRELRRARTFRRATLVVLIGGTVVVGGVYGVLFATTR